MRGDATFRQPVDTATMPGLAFGARGKQCDGAPEPVP